MRNISDKFRMVQWLLMSFLVYLVAAFLASQAGPTDAGLYPRAQTVLWKVGHLNLAAFLGYWVDRNAFRDNRIYAGTSPLAQIRRAIIIGACMLAFGLAI